MPGKGDWILSWILGTLEKFQAEEEEDHTGLGAYEYGHGCQLGDKRTESGRPEAAMLETSLLTALKGGTAQFLEDQEVAAPTLCESSSRASGDWGLSYSLTLCFLSGSECAASCLDHNSESIILPVNVTVRDIPHWLNPTRVEVSDRDCPHS